MSGPTHTPDQALQAQLQRERIHCGMHPPSQLVPGRQRGQRLGHAQLCTHRSHRRGLGLGRGHSGCCSSHATGAFRQGGDAALRIGLCEHGKCTHAGASRPVRGSAPGNRLWAVVVLHLRGCELVHSGDVQQRGARQRSVEIVKRTVARHGGTSRAPSHNWVATMAPQGAAVHGRGKHRQLRWEQRDSTESDGKRWRLLKELTLCAHAT
jgi:hypothetical protein